MSEEIERHVVRKFEICQRLGKGVREPLRLQSAVLLFSQAYGIVWKAVEKKSRAVVALKKCFDAFRNATDSQRTFREIMYLQVRSAVPVLLLCPHNLLHQLLSPL
jgi:mitogen-activated protein kinase 15